MSVAINTEFLTVSMDTTENDVATFMIRKSEIVCVQRVDKVVTVFCKQVQPPWAFNLPDAERAESFLQLIELRMKQ